MLWYAALIMVMTGIAQCAPVQNLEVGESTPELMHQECLELQGKDESETMHLRADCEFIFNNEYIKWSQRMLQDPNFIKGLEVIDVTNKTNDEIDSHRRAKRSAKSTCPVYDEMHLTKAKTPKERSLSPWEFVLLLDRTRVPRQLIDSKCLCEGCINMTTGREDKKNFISHPLYIEVPVRYGRQLSTTRVSLGCTCMFPLYPASPS